MMRLLATGLCLSACRAEAPTAVDWCEVPLPEPVAARATPDAGFLYELYVRSFQDTDGDGVGDLAGVTAHLDYLQGMGVSTLWLMPVFESPEPSGYAPSSLHDLNPDYGDEAQLAELLAEASTRGMRVLLDVPINHTSDAHPWFQAALADPESARTEDYLFSEHQWDTERWYPTGDGRFYYAFFGEQYPDLDLTREGVGQSLKGALAAWLDQGVGGYRVDAVVQLIEEDDAVTNTEGSHCLMAWLTAALHSEHPDAVLLSEAWSQDPEQNQGWLGEDSAPEADLILDVPRRWRSLEAWTTGDPKAIRDLLEAQAETGVGDRMATYLSSHDVARLSLELADARTRRATMVLHLLAPGQPILYYGDELDLPSAPPDGGQDEPQRAPMLWDDTYNAGFTTGVPWYSIDQRYLNGYNAAAQAEDPDSMLRLVSALGELRAQSESARSGSLSFLETGSTSVLAMGRMTETEGVLVLVNFSETALSGLSLVLPRELGAWTDLSSGQTLPGGPDGVALPDLLPFGYAVLGTSTLAAISVPGPVED